MKVHYMNILFFALPFNILEHNNNKPYITQHGTTRLLCECNIYSSIYDNDPEMKKVMQDFNRQTSQRFEEYNERMIKNRQKCKDQCDKDIQKIILKDKIEKQLEERFSALETNIDTNDIPTCVCETSVADKIEKTCLKCGKNLGGFVPGLGFIGGYGVNSMVEAAIAAGIVSAEKAAIEAGTQAGIQAAIEGVISKFSLNTLGGKALVAVINANNFKNHLFFSGQIMADYIEMSSAGSDKLSGVFHYIYEIYSGDNNMIMKFILENSKDVARSAGQAASKMTTETTEALTLQKTAEATSVSAIFSNPIVISFIVVVIMVIVLLIIYLILRYRRKKKMKKKLQYIKLLKE